uniref:MATH domain-containing protein n=1 Tax=Leersia perrieri TaxID=77586 RepID=A0A0D9XUD5_9ORYZ
MVYGNIFRTSPSCSTIVVSEASGYHILKIDGYTRTKMMVATGEHLNSGEFNVGDYTWRLMYYPNGHDQKFSNFISFGLERTTSVAGSNDGKDDVHVHVRVKISLLDNAGEPVADCSNSDKGIQEIHQEGRSGEVWKSTRDIDPAAFDALLHFIYTDMLQETEEENVTAMAQHLLVAADRYDMERLKKACEEKIARHLDVGTAAMSLALAEQHGCSRLKEAIMRFIVMSPARLKTVMATDGYKHLVICCPSIANEILAMLASHLT